MKFGIIGTNFVSDFFMNGAKESERCEVVAVCSRKRIKFSGVSEISRRSFKIKF